MSAIQGSGLEGCLQSRGLDYRVFHCTCLYSGTPLYIILDTLGGLEIKGLHILIFEVSLCQRMKMHYGKVYVTANHLVPACMLHACVCPLRRGRLAMD